MSRRSACLFLAIAVLAPQGARPAAAGDFDGDGADDLVIGAPLARIASVSAQGEVHVLYGGLGVGPGTIGLQVLSRLTFEPGATILDFVDSGFLLGASVATGDFDADGFDDLALGAPAARVGKHEAAGKVYVLRGSAAGLATTGFKTFSAATKGVKGSPAANGLFGWRLCTGDFDGDGFDDLAIGHNATVKKVIGAGAVHVLFGSNKGLRAKRNRMFTTASKGVPGDPGQQHSFGLVLAAGDLDGDGRDELAVGMPTIIGGDLNVGNVTVLRGSKKGTVAKGALQFGIAAFGGEQQSFEPLALACGDFDADGFAELAAGWPGGRAGNTDGAGVVAVIPGTADGPDLTATQILHQSVVAAEGVAAAGDEFGATLAVGDFDADGFPDLAVGAPSDAESGVMNSGSVQVFHGGASGLLPVVDVLLHQEVAGIADAAASGNAFGQTLSTGDYDGNGAADLSVGVPWQDIGAAQAAGAVHVLPGIPAFGLAPGLSTYWHRDTAGIPGVPEASERYGSGL